MKWASRRDMLRALGVGACATAVAPFAMSCRRRSTTLHTEEATRAISIDDLHKLLRAVVGTLSREFERAEGWIEKGHHTQVAIDAEGRHLMVTPVHRAVLTAHRAERTFARCTTDLTISGLAGAATLLRAKGNRETARKRQRQVRVTKTRWPTDPRTLSAVEWLGLGDALAQRAQRVSDTRIVYRGATLEIDDCDILFVGPDSEYLQRRTWCQSSAVFGAKTPAGYAFEAASAGGRGGLEVAVLDDEAIAAAAASALTILTPRAAPTGTMRVALGAEVASLLVGECLAPLFSATEWARRPATGRPRSLGNRHIGSELVTLTEAARLLGSDGRGNGNGSDPLDAFDDEGTAIRPLVLIERGVARPPASDRRSARVTGLPATGNGWRPRNSEWVDSHCVDIALACGASDEAALLLAVGDGVLLEGAVSADVDLASGTYLVRARRARGIKNGVLSGFVYGEIELTGMLEEFLNGVFAVGDTARPTVVRDSRGLLREQSAPMIASIGRLGASA